MNTTLSGNVKDGLALLNKAGSECKSSKGALFNLIIYTHDEKRVDYCNQIVKMVTEQFPCRIFFIKALPQNDSTLTLNYGVKTNDKGNTFSSDFIAIEAANDGLNRVPYLIVPNLVPDLPVFLFWDEDSTKESIILPALKILATRLIYDSESMSDLQNFASNMQKELQVKNSEVVDMNWIRISGWRQVIAQTFDTKDRIELLKKAALIEFVYNDLNKESAKCRKTQAIYLQAWLASRLGWQFNKIEKKAGKLSIYYKNDSNDLTITLSPQTRQDLASEEIIECHLSAPNIFECDFDRCGPTQVQVKASDQYQCRIPFNLLLPTLESGRSFVQEIFYQKIDPHYEEILPFLNRINWSEYGE